MREVDEVRSRISQQFETAARHCQRTPPVWLPPEFYDRALEILQSGRRLSLSWNASGPYVRKKGRAANGQDHPEPAIDASGAATTEEVKVNGAAPPINETAAPVGNGTAATAFSADRFRRIGPH